MIDANALLDEIRQEFQPVKEQLLRHHYVQALEEGKIGREKLRLFAGEQYTIITSDLRSVEKKPGRRSETYLAERAETEPHGQLGSECFLRRGLLVAGNFSHLCLRRLP
jgi:thiaminase